MKRSMIIILGVVVVVVLTVIFAMRRQCATTCQAPETPVAPAVVDVPPTNFVAERMADPVYVEALKSLTGERRQKANEAHSIRERMEEKVAAAAAALKAEADAAPSAASLPDEADVGKMQDEALQARLQKDPEWVALDAERAQIAIELDNIQHRVAVLVRERMKAQVARRQGIPRPSRMKPAPAINVMTNLPPMLTPEPVVMTNAPAVDASRLPAVPARLPVDPSEAPAETENAER